MKGRFLSEAAAYRFVLLTLAHLAAIDLAAHIGGGAAALTMVAFLALVALVRFLTRGRPEPPSRSRDRPGRRPGDGRRWILVVANETVDGERLRDEIDRGREGFQGRVLVVAPALNSRLRHWVSDEDEARAAAGERLRVVIDGLAEAGIDAYGEIGDPNPLQAIADVLSMFPADEVIITTSAPERANRLERDVVARAGRRFAVPITHVGPEPAVGAGTAARPESTRGEEGREAAVVVVVPEPAPATGSPT